MIVIRLDRRLLYAVLGILVVVVALGIGILLGRGTSSSPATAVAVPQAPIAQPQQPGAAVPQQNPAAQPPDPNVPLVSVDEARQKLGQAGVVFVDARTDGEFKQGHIKGAINAPASDTAKMNTLPKDKELVIYCA